MKMFSMIAETNYVLTSVLDWIIIGFTAGVFSVLLDCYMSEDMILGRYGKWIRSKGYWGKPFGGCVKCMGGQLSLWMYMISEWGDFQLMGLIFTMGLSHAIILKLKFM